MFTIMILFPCITLVRVLHGSCHLCLHEQLEALPSAPGNQASQGVHGARGEAIPKESRWLNRTITSRHRYICNQYSHFAVNHAHVPVTYMHNHLGTFDRRRVPPMILPCNRDRTVQYGTSQI